MSFRKICVAHIFVKFEYFTKHLYWFKLQSRAFKMMYIICSYLKVWNFIDSHSEAIPESFRENCSFFKSCEIKIFFQYLKLALLHVKSPFDRYIDTLIIGVRFAFQKLSGGGRGGGGGEQTASAFYSIKLYTHVSSSCLVAAKIFPVQTLSYFCLTEASQLSGGFLVTNWLAREQQMLRDVGFYVFCRFNSKPTQLVSTAASDF